MINMFVFLEVLQNSQIHSEDIFNIFDKAIKLYLEKRAHLKILTNSLMAICSRCKCTYISFSASVQRSPGREGQKQKCLMVHIQTALFIFVVLVHFSFWQWLQCLSLVKLLYSRQKLKMILGAIVT